MCGGKPRSGLKKKILSWGNIGHVGKIKLPPATISSWFNSERRRWTTLNEIQQMWTDRAEEDAVRDHLLDLQLRCPKARD